jgi:phenylacetate-CoA ligase
MTAIADHDVEQLRARMRSLLGARLPEHVHRLGWTADQLATHQRDRLRALLARAIAHSPFHARRLRGIDPHRFELADLRQLPVMTKSEMMADFDDVITDRRIDRRSAERHLASSECRPSLLLDQYVCLASGGSSGQRGLFLQTLDEFGEFVGSLMRGPIAGLGYVGGAPLPRLTIGLVAAASVVHSTGFGAAVASDPIQLISIPATLRLSELVERLNQLQPPVLMGYPTKLVQLATEQHAGRLRIRPRSVTATSETLTSDMREAITAAFGVPVSNQFASTEGLVGGSAPGHSVLTFATDTCLVEVLDAEGRPVGDHVGVDRVLVTNLHNLTQPLIRYELTDRFVAYPDDEQGRLRAVVEGRADETFRYGGAEVHPHAIRTVLVRTPAISEYQVQQTACGIHVDAVIDGALDEATLVASLVDSLRQARVPKANATVRIVTAIERHPETGKVRRFVPFRT